MPTCYRHPGRETYISCQRCARPICPDCMRDASVGFQCPSCVAEGAKTTRSGRTAYGGLRPSNASTTSGVLIGINVAVWLAILVSGGNSSRLLEWLVLRPSAICGLVNGSSLSPHGMCTAEGGLYYPGVADGAPWQLLTSLVTHVELLHIGFNMLALWVLGPQLEIAVGRARFLALYLLSGLAGSVLVYFASPQYQATLGASGAIFGLLGALLVVVIKVRGDVRSVLLWIGVNAAFTVFGGASISWQGHLGGFLGGVVIGVAIAYAPRRHRTPVQIAALTSFGVLLIVLTLIRTAALS